MPPQGTKSDYDIPSFKDDALFESGLMTREKLIRLTDEAFEAYKAKEGYTNPSAAEFSQIGATASRYESTVPQAAELAKSYELPELSLEQLGRNIEAVRYDALHKDVNNADAFIAKKSDYDLAA